MEIVERLLAWVLERAIYGVPLLLALFLIRAVIKRAPKWVACLMWTVAALGLLCPVMLESPASLYNAGQGAGVLVGSSHVEDGAQARPQLEISLRLPDGADRDGIGDGGERAEPLEKEVIVPALWPTVVWMAGICAMALYWMLGTVRLRRRVRVSAQAEYGVFICDDIHTAFILGLLRPKIYVPSYITDGERELVVAHERAHIERLDHLWKLLGFVVLSVYWFHPLCWIAYILFCRDLEAACDQRVVRKLDGEERREYSKALLNMGSRGRIGAAHLAFGEIGIRSRIKAVLNYKKPAVWITAVAIIVCCAVAVCFLTAPVTDGEGGADIADEPKGDEIVEDGTIAPEEPPDGNETQNIGDEAVELRPGQVSGVLRAEIHEWFGDFTLTDGESLYWLEEHINGAEELEYATACPFGIDIYVYMEDGTVGTIQPASDSCDVFLSGGIYYDAGSGWNERLWQIFGIDTYFTLRELDDEGRIIKEVDYSWFMPAGTEEYEYDDFGRLISEQYGAGDGEETLHRTEYTYNSGGQLVRMDRLLSNADGQLQMDGYLLYGYDSAGNMVSSQAYSSEGQLIDFTGYEYDSSGRCSKKTYDDGSYVEYAYGEDGSVTERPYSPQGELFSWTVTWYDEAENVVRREFYEADGSLNYFETFSYDEKGEMTGHSSYNGDGEPISG